MNDPTPSPEEPGRPAWPHGNHRARRLLETALGTPEPRPEEWPALRWRPPEAAQVQDWLTDYEITARFARGSSGAVYAGIHRLLARKVALKVLAPMADPGPVTAERNLSEGRLLASLSHPNILRVCDSRPLPDGQHLLVFDYAEGGSLRQRLAAGPVPLEQTLSHAHQITGGLAHAHTQGIVHRDLKPENILFDAHGSALIADFGSAMFTAPGMESATGGSTGTPDYRAPEQAEGRPPHPAADLYSLGVMLHELLTGCLPLSPAGPSQAAGLHPSVPASVRPLLAALLGPESSRRSLKTAEIADALQALRQPPPAPPRRRTPAIFLAAAALLLLGTGWLASRWQDPAVSPKSTPKPPPLPLPLVTRNAVVESLTRFRRLEASGAWTESHAAYAPVVDYFDGGLVPHDRIVQERGDFAARRQAFRSVPLADPDFLSSPPEAVSLTLSSWSETPHRNHPTATLGFTVEQITWTPATAVSWPWQIIRHSNTGSEYWSAPADRILDETAATEFLDTFLKAEAADDRPGQVKAFAQRFLYYGNWQDQALLLEGIARRQADRPDFHCERLGPVTLERGTLSRWKATFSSLSLPRRPRSPVSGTPTPGSRVFLIVPGPGPRWFILGEASGISGLPELERFFKAQP